MNFQRTRISDDPNDCAAKSLACGLGLTPIEFSFPDRRFEFSLPQE